MSDSNRALGMNLKLLLKFILDRWYHHFESNKKDKIGTIAIGVKSIWITALLLKQ